jgi:ATP-binding cassette, subfamily F, member 3
MLRIDNLIFDAWGRRFFDSASVTIPAGTKVGLVGRNGVGKSTLFRLIKGEFVAQGGDIEVPKRARIGSVDQEHPATPVSLLDTILAADTRRDALSAQLETAAPEELAEIYHELSAIDADRAPARAAEILSGLGFANDDLPRAMAEFSGGWRMRVALAAALFAEPELLLLDEPTNYLDLEGALWLEARLKKYPHTALIVSHDRELLNNSVDAILHLSAGKLALYTGGYNAFETQRAERTRLQAATRAKQEAERAHLQKFIDRFRAKASKATQAQSRIKRLAKLEPIAAPVEERVAPFMLPSPRRPLAPPLIQLEAAAVAYDGPPVLRNLNLRLDVDDRIGLLGVNGAGKTTFAKLLAGALPLQSGRMVRENRIKVGWFHQHQIEALDPEDTPLDIIRRALPDDAEPVRRSRLAQFGLSFDKQDTTVGDLSGGERARLLLNLVAMAEPHLLILDEPTNHLDIDSRRALLDALNDYEGAVIIITHDRSLMELVADRLWLTADGNIKPFKGDMDDYARFVLERARAGSRPSQDDETAGAGPQGAGRHVVDHLADAKAVLTREQQAARQARYAAKKAAKLKRRESRR